MANLSYTIDRAAGIVRLHYSGAPEWSEMKDILEAILRDPNHRPGDGILADRSRLDTPQTAGYIQKIISYVRHRQEEFGAARWALVVKPGAPYGMGRMAQALGDDIPAMDLELFDDPAEAERWLREGSTGLRSTPEAS